MTFAMGGAPAPGSDRIPVELFQILKDYAVESAALNMQYAICTQYAIRRLPVSTHSSTLAWGIPWTEETGRLQSMWSLSQTRMSDFTFTFHFHALVKEMATHSSVLAWRILGTGEPGGLPTMGSHRVRHD